MGISKNGGNWHLEAFLCYFTCLNLIFFKILGNFQLGHHYYCLTVTGHVLATTSSNEYAKQPTLDFTILSTLQYTTIYVFVLDEFQCMKFFLRNTTSSQRIWYIYLYVLDELQCKKKCLRKLVRWVESIIYSTYFFCSLSALPQFK